MIGAPIVRGLDLGGVVGDLVVAERHLQHHLVRGGVRQRVVGHVVGVAVGLAAVPQHLDQGEPELALERVLVGGVVGLAVGALPVDAAVQQGRVVHAGTPRMPRWMSGETATSEPPMIPPWLLPS
jgi:hypothetical protein